MISFTCNFKPGSSRKLKGTWTLLFAEGLGPVGPAGDGLVLLALLVYLRANVCTW